MISFFNCVFKKWNISIYMYAFGILSGGLATYKFSYLIMNLIRPNKTELVKDIETIVPYETRYMDKFDKMKNIFDVDEQSKQKMIRQYDEVFNTLVLNYKNKLYSLQQEINNSVQSDDEYSYDEEQDKEHNDYLIDSIEDIKYKLDDNAALILQEAKDIVHLQFKNDLLMKLQNNYVLEKTPISNVIMVYNNDKNGFQYFSDNAIPYRYLEVVCRKYVIQFNCKPLFISNYMSNDLKDKEKKIIKFIYEGKISNFNILKPVKDKNIFTKKNGKMSFADFKKQKGLF